MPPVQQKEQRRRRQLQPQRFHQLQRTQQLVRFQANNGAAQQQPEGGARIPQHAGQARNVPIPARQNQRHQVLHASHRVDLDQRARRVERGDVVPTRGAGQQVVPALTVAQIAQRQNGQQPLSAIAPAQQAPSLLITM